MPTALPAPPGFLVSLVVLVVNVVGLFSYNMSPHNEHVHFTPNERTVGVLGGSDNRFAAEVEGGVQKNGDAGEIREAADQGVIQRILLFEHRLKPSGPVDVRGRGNLFSLLWSDL